MFDLFLYLIIFIFGLIVGSFLNCVIYRLETGGSFLKGRSFCPHCKYELSWQDLIPVLSFLILKRKCRYCQKPISWQYPLVEITTGIIFLLIFIFHFQAATFQNFPSIGFLLCISCFMILIFVYDLKYFIIPDRVIYPAIFITFLYQLFAIWSFSHWDSVGYWSLVIGHLVSAFGAALFFLLIVLVSRGRWMGVGDIKLAFFMGLFLGWPNILVALFLAFFIGAVIGITLMILEKKTLKSEIPFGPFLVTGTFLALFLGEKIIHWYLNFVLL